MEASAKKILVLGLGNDIISDDAVGLFVARAVRERLGNALEVDVVDCCEMGLSLLDYIVGHKFLLVVDSVQTGEAAPGTIHEVGEEDLKTLPGMSPHFLGVGEILVLGRTLGLPMPGVVKIFAIEVADAHTLCEQLTPELQQALPGIVERALQVVQAWR
ncbi:MAG: hydrogenase maturation protease [Verrucomicrobiota bacterium]